MTAIRVLSYNVRYANRDDHHDAWHDRRDAVGRLVRFHRPDVAAFQEPLPGQRRDLRERLSEYEFVGRGREADDEGESCPIAVRTDRWEVVDDDTFWLSETPSEPSTDWGADYRGSRRGRESGRSMATPPSSSSTRTSTTSARTPAANRRDCSASDSRT